MTGESTKMSDWFDNEQTAEATIEEAEESAVTSWEMQFVDGVRRRFDHYGLSSFMSESQYEQLVKIAAS